MSVYKSNKNYINIANTHQILRNNFCRETRRSRKRYVSQGLAAYGVEC